MAAQRSTTPVRPNQAPPSQSVTRVSRYFAEHKRDQVQVFAYDEKLHKLQDFESSGDLLRFLHGSSGEPIPLSSIPRINEWSAQTFLNAANTIAKSIKSERRNRLSRSESLSKLLSGALDFSTSDTLVFKNTGDKSHLGHVTDTGCRPDFIAVFDADFKNKKVLWPYIHLTGEHASKGKTREDQKRQAISYLHYLLLARPDLYVAQGMLTSRTGIIFLVGIGGHGIRSFAVRWSCKELTKLMYAFIFCLYRPGKFADPSYEIGHVRDNQVTYTIKIPAIPGVDGVATGQQVVLCRDFLPIYAASPFATRTHVFSNPNSEVTISNKRLTVLKDQLCRVGTRFHEHDILKRVHTQEEKVPGVVEAVYNAVIELPLVGEPVRREKHRLGMGQYGDPFMTIPNVKAMLEVVFDILEVLRFLRMHRKVLHRDISKGNVVYVNRPQNDTAEVRSATARECKKPPVFARYFLGESNNPHETSALLIDFNHAEILDMRTDGGRGTAVFIARAIQLGHAVQFTPWFPHPTPASPGPYAQNYPERLEKFKPGRLRAVEEHSKDSAKRAWRHELDHDVESVFWLMFYWALSARPEEHPNEPINPVAWNSLIGAAGEREALMDSLSARRNLTGTVHSAFSPLMDLISSLAGVLQLDRHWLNDSDPINDPEYIVEVFQRLVLQFILDNRGKAFMGIQVDPKRRDIPETPQILGLSSTTSQRSNSENAKKRTRTKVDDNSNQRSPKRKTLEADQNHVEEDEALPDVDDTVDDTEENWLQ
ncbi:hypothetical protein M407DRAFT_25171 [Tulasnella calospora MUT 4182]|uniref:Fungal-type protein kinase domain-containing protein n=1 Tax=Tulasnella calospora MUT 4182 TaxID=1051891 RepID=A0A0C3LVR2_9AGAM|nr:hypothetical protein M407DRAFT_25171 [Tulasnella calospora MUT 4182]